MCVLSIKVPIRKKSGNLFNDPYNVNTESSVFSNSQFLAYAFIGPSFFFVFVVGVFWYALYKRWSGRSNYWSFWGGFANLYGYIVLPLWFINLLPQLCLVYDFPFFIIFYPCYSNYFCLHRLAFAYFPNFINLSFIHLPCSNFNLIPVWFESFYNNSSVRFYLF